LNISVLGIERQIAKRRSGRTYLNGGTDTYVKRISARIRDESPPAWTTVASGVRIRGMVEGYGASIDLYQLAPRRRFEQHEHPFSELGVLLSGQGALLVDGEKRAIREGDSFYVPGGTPHGFVVGEGRPAVLMNVNVPQPPDVSGAPSSEVVRLATKAIQISP